MNTWRNGQLGRFQAKCQCHPVLGQWQEPMVELVLLGFAAWVVAFEIVPALAISMVEPMPEECQFIGK
jgi:hypothetical protein